MSGKAFQGTTDELREKIAWLEDDIASCHAAMRNAESAGEKAEYRMRAQADREELMHQLSHRAA